MSDWCTCPLGNVAEVQTGPFGSQLHQSDYRALGTPIITVEHLGDNRIIHSNLPLVGDDDKQRLKKYMLRAGDIVFSRVGSVDRCAFVHREEDGWMFSGRLLRVRAREEAVDSRFLSFYFCQESFKDTIRMIAVGATMPSINTEILSTVEVTLPPLPEQCAIAGVLSSLDDKIDLLHRQNKTLEGIASALWRKMFIEDADPGWKKGKLGDLVEETIGGDWGEDYQSDDLIPVVCLRGVDLQRIKESGFSSEAPVRFIRPASLDKRKLSENEILMAGSGVGPIGKSIPIISDLLSCYSYPVIYSNFCKRLKAESKEIALFVEFMISWLYREGELDQYHTGTSVPNFNLKDLMTYEMTIPSRGAMSTFSSFLMNSYAKKFSNQATALSRLRDTLLPKLMSGEVRVQL